MCGDFSRRLDQLHEERGALVVRIGGKNSSHISPFSCYCVFDEADGGELNGTLFPFGFPFAVVVDEDLPGSFMLFDFDPGIYQLFLALFGLSWIIEK